MMASAKRRRRWPRNRESSSAPSSRTRRSGRYATLWHTGHPDGLAGATRTLLDWAAQQGLAWDVTSTPDGERWGGRLEIYHDEPGQDMSEWETELAFKLTN
jgi:hypothetical protein